ncbi:efflux RND transporter periplasmic adaptor subunit [Sulfurimonas sp.]|uniref:efflux RND transporter periplasmic adaptor subunit n=1 Tax=Sulfurimonas sp. TaxID=2022749 RepID=UPI002B4A1FA3|nr:efflux RND transporter periplasmic adaptor subunit [Sulfurimonas sp.]
MLKTLQNKKKKYCLIILPLIVLSFTACEDKKSSEEIVKTLRPVKFITVDISANGRSHTYFGTSQAEHEADLSFRVSGIIQKISVKVGDKLKRGDAIAGLEKVSFELEVDKQRSSLAQMKADSRKARSNYQRTKELYENNNISIEELESARTSAESARAQEASSKKTLKQKELDLKYTQLRSREKCSVSEVFKELHENVTAGEHIVSVACGKVNEVKIAVPENYINSIKKGMFAKVKFNSITNTEFSAKVTEVSVRSSTSTTFPVILTLNESYDSNIRSGMAAEVTFIDNKKDKKSSNIYLPPIAVGEDVQGRYIFVLIASKTAGEGIIKRKPVRIGELTSSGIEILEGVQAGDKVVTAGMSVIRDDLIVKMD